MKTALSLFRLRNEKINTITLWSLTEIKFQRWHFVCRNRLNEKKKKRKIQMVFPKRREKKTNVKFDISYAVAEVMHALNALWLHCFVVWSSWCLFAWIVTGEHWCIVAYKDESRIISLSTKTTKYSSISVIFGVCARSVQLRESVQLSIVRRL